MFIHVYVCTHVPMLHNVHVPPCEHKCVHICCMHTRVSVYREGVG